MASLKLARDLPDIRHSTKEDATSTWTFQTQDALLSYECNSMSLRKQWAPIHFNLCWNYTRSIDNVKISKLYILTSFRHKYKSCTSNLGFKKGLIKSRKVILIEIQVHAVLTNKTFYRDSCMCTQIKYLKMLHELWKGISRIKISLIFSLQFSSCY